MTGTQARGIGNSLAPARFVLFLALLPAGWFGYRALVPDAVWSDTAAMAFDFAAIVFLVSLIPLLRDRTAEAMRRHARNNDANRVVVLVVTTLVSLTITATLTGELKQAQAGEVLAMIKLVGTLLIVWLFSNAVFALHYAHAYYSEKPKHGGDAGGLEFPGEEPPDYVDFFYFAFTLGMTFQTSDVAIANPRLRGVALLHSFAAFIFNIGVLAFSVNVLAGSSGG